MKRTFLGLLFFSLVFVACGNGTTDSKSFSFNGIKNGSHRKVEWIGPYEDNYSSLNNYRSIFAGDSFTIYKLSFDLDGWEHDAQPGDLLPPEAYNSYYEKFYEGTFLLNKEYTKIYVTVRKYKNMWQEPPYTEEFNFKGIATEWTDGFTISEPPSYGGPPELSETLTGTWRFLDEEPPRVGLKPVKLASTATYQETVDKLDEIITYCNNNPGPENVNLSLKSGAEARKGLIAPLESIWSSVRDTHIPLINSNIIDQLQ